MFLLNSVQVLDPKVLPMFPFRDDAIPLYHSIEDYVSKVLNFYYGKKDTDAEESEKKQEVNDLTHI